ncbi:MAG: hypothetical protein K2G84_04305 [Muribaculaceae bacterium]|nr:hypothetical protein [Muribaculaceae bacterium]
MTRAIITKEFLKTRRAFWCSVVLTLFFTVYALLGVNRVIATHGVEHVWLIMLMKDQTFIDAVKYVPLLCGLLVGLSQMVPEMQLNRLKLTLHLPCPSLRLLMTMLATGFAELSVVFILQFAAIWIFYDRVIAPEMTWHVLLTSLPWYLAGYTAYFFSAAVCLEGKWRRRILLALTGAGVVTFYYLQPAPGAYNGFLPVALIATLLLAMLSYASIDRFKQGLID